MTFEQSHAEMNPDQCMPCSHFHQNVSHLIQIQPRLHILLTIHLTHTHEQSGDRKHGLACSMAMQQWRMVLIEAMNRLCVNNPPCDCRVRHLNERQCSVSVQGNDSSWCLLSHKGFGQVLNLHALIHIRLSPAHRAEQKICQFP